MCWKTGTSHSSVLMRSNGTSAGCITLMVLHWLDLTVTCQKFSDSGDLKTRVRRHEGVKPCVCSNCPNNISIQQQSWDNVRQLAAQSDLKPFYCILCYKSLSRAASVKEQFKRRYDKLSFSGVWRVSLNVYCVGSRVFQNYSSLLICVHCVHVCVHLFIVITR